MKKKDTLAIHKRPEGLTKLQDQLAAFATANRRLLGLLLLLLVGVVVGCVVYARLPQEQTAALSAMLTTQPVQPTAEGVGQAMLSALFLPLMLLVVLFLAALTPYGVPLILLVPIFFGLGLGLTEAQYLALGAVGFKAVLLLVLPHALLTVMSVLVGSSEALRMSCLFSRQLLPSSAHCGGLWNDFKLCFARFLIALALAVGAALANVAARLLFI